MLPSFDVDSVHSLYSRLKPYQLKNGNLITNSYHSVDLEYVLVWLSSCQVVDPEEALDRVCRDKSVIVCALVS